MSERRVSRRAGISAALLVLALTGLAVRLTFLHILTDDKVRRAIDRGNQVEKKILAGRGSVCDCRGRDNLVALNLAVKDVCVDPATIAASNAAPKVAATLSRMLGLPPRDVAAKMSRPERRCEYVQRFVPEDAAAAVLTRKLPGVFLKDETVRNYPHKNLMCHVLGFVNQEGIGSAGIEQAADRYLRGSPGLIESRVNAMRQEVYEQRTLYVPPLEGSDVVLTIDQNLQHVVELVLDATMAQHHAKGAWAIVERVRTGEILAMASRPCFDLNDYRTADSNALMNRAVGYVYEPGSTLKAVAISAALNEHTVNPDIVFDCENGAWLYRGHILRDYHPYDKLTVADGVKKSSNILTAKVALTLGDERLHHYMRAFGIGERTGIELPGEESGILHPVKEWSGLSVTRVAIGQGVAVTALQMMGVFCAIANDGFLMKPYVIKRIATRDGKVLVESRPQVISRPITRETAAVMRRLLRRVTEDGGTGKRAGIEGYAVAGKTGTAQKPIPGGYSSSENVASFVGFLPAEEPEIGIIVVVDTPQPEHTGGVVAAPAFARIAEQAVRYMGVMPVEQMIAEHTVNRRN